MMTPKILPLILWFSLSLWQGCGPSLIGSISSSQSEAPAELLISPSSKVLAVQNSMRFSATGGDGNYLFSIVEGQGTLDAVTGDYIAPTAPGSATVRVTDGSLASADAVITINEALSVSPNSIQLLNPPGASEFLPAPSGGVPPYSYRITSGAGQVDASTGRFTHPLDTGESIVQISDDFGNAVDLNLRSSPIFTDYAVTRLHEQAGALYMIGEFNLASPLHVPGMVFMDPVTGEPTSSPCNWYRKLDTWDKVNDAIVVGDSIYLGGTLTRFAGQPVKNLIKIDKVTCELDTAFSQADGPSSQVFALAHHEGFVYLGGQFSTYRGAAAQFLARVSDSSGELDTAFTQATGFNSAVKTLLVDGEALFAGGQFTTYRGGAATRIAKILLADGSLDPAFAVTGANSTVEKIIKAGSSIYVGGQFTTFGGATALRIAKVDPTTGAVDAVFSSNDGASGIVSSLAFDDEGLFAVGGFTSYRGENFDGVVKIDLLSGVPLVAFTFGVNDAFLLKNAVTSGDSLYVVGSLTTYAGAPAPGIVKVNRQTGALDSNFTFESGFGSVNYPDWIQVVDGALMVGGGFAFYGGVAANGLAKFDLATGIIDRAFTVDAKFGGFYPLAIAGQGDSIYLGGGFSNYRDQTVESLIKVDASTGDLDTTFSQNPGAGGWVRSLALRGSSLYAGGSFTTYRGTGVNRLIKVDATTGVMDAAFSAGGGPNSTVFALIAGDTGLYIGGSFTDYRGDAQADSVTLVDYASGGAVGGFVNPGGTSGSVYALARDSGSLYIGGGLTNYGGSAVQRIAKIDASTGALDATFTTASGFDSTVEFIAADARGVYVAGRFTNYRGVNAKRLVRLDATTGDLDASFGPAEKANGDMASLLLRDSEVWVCGYSEAYGGEDAYYVYRLGSEDGGLK